MENDASSVKQQLVEALRGAESVVITTSKNPSKDDIAAAIGLHLLLQKQDKVAEVVITQPLPKQLGFLKSDMVNQELQGQRDFVVELDQSRVEADNLKYVNEDNKLKIYITPYNGSFTKDDASFSYGDYHCDAVIGIGAQSVADVDEVIRSEEKLAQNTQFLLINTHQQDGATTDGSLNWNEPQASSVCEMVMSMSEALGSGMLDDSIATALLTGIIDKTNHFTNQATTPKVMTMSAQLLAAGAKQSEIIQRLSEPQQPESVTQKTEKKEATEESAADKDSQPNNEFQIRKQKPADEDESGEDQLNQSKSFNVREGNDQSKSKSQPQPQPQPQPEAANQTPPNEQQQAQKPPHQPQQTNNPPAPPSSPPTTPASPAPSQGNTGGAAVNASRQPNPAATQQPPASKQQDQNSSDGHRKVVQPPGSGNSEALMAALNTNDNQPAPQSQPTQPPQQPNAQGQSSSQSEAQPKDKEADLHSARRAVEQALQNTENPPDPNQQNQQ